MQSIFKVMQIPKARILPVILLSGGLLCSQSGCINTMVMVGKVLMGDPMQRSGFEQATGISLAKDQKRVLIRVSTPALVAEANARLTADVEDELIRRMKRHDIQVLHPDTSAKVLDRLGGSFDPQVLAREVKDVDYIMHIKLETFSYLEDSSPNFYRGNSTGVITAYEVRDGETGKHAVQVFEQRYQSTYPTTYPVAVDSTPKNVFVRRFIDRLSDNLGATFYSVNRSELYAK